MDFRTYDEQTQILVKKMKQALPEEGKRVFGILRKLERRALASGDPALIGYTYLNYVNAYFYRERFEPIRPYLHQAIRYLLRSNENEELSRAYTHFAVDAQRIGVFDIAYHYFRMAASFVSEDATSVSLALVNSNLGDLLAEMGDFKRAIPYTRKSLKVMDRKKDTFLSRQNSILIRTNLALYRLYAGDMQGARRECVRIEKDLKAVRETDSRAHLWYLILRTHMAILSGDRDGTRRLTDEVIRKIVHTDSYVLFSKDMFRLQRSLIRYGAKKEAGRLIEAVGKVSSPDESYYAQFLHEQIKIRYYKLTGNRKALREAYARRQQIAALQQEEMRKVYRDSASLMQLMEELQKEQEDVRRENEKLQQEADTDELTMLHNRNALNRVMEETFERCRKRKTTFGIGIVDIDAFKYYNDTYGHQQGDACLKTVADELRKIAATDDLFVARYGGDEFVLVFENRSEEEMDAVEKKILTRAPVPVTCGRFSAPASDDLKLWDYFAAADAQMYRRKKSGR